MPTILGTDAEDFYRSLYEQGGRVLSEYSEHSNFKMRNRDTYGGVNKILENFILFMHELQTAEAAEAAPNEVTFKWNYHVIRYLLNEGAELPIANNHPLIDRLLIQHLIHELSEPIVLTWLKTTARVCKKEVAEVCEDKSSDTNRLAMLLNNGTAQSILLWLNANKENLHQLEMSTITKLFNKIITRIEKISDPSAANETILKIKTIETDVDQQKAAQLLSAQQKLAERAKPLSEDKKQKIVADFNKATDVLQMNQLALLIESKSKRRLADDEKKDVSSNSLAMFMIFEDDLKEFQEVLKNLLTQETVEKDIRFQIIFKSNQANHYSVGEIRIDKNTTPPCLRFLHIDPSVTYYSPVDVLGSQFIMNELPKIAKLELFTTRDLLQKSGEQCHIFSADIGFMLSNQSQYVDVFEFMQRKGNKTLNYLDNASITFTNSELPIRLKRASHVVENEKIVVSWGTNLFKSQKEEMSFKGLKETLAEDNTGQEIVSKKRGIKTASTSIKDNLEPTIVKKEGQEPKETTHNVRIDKKEKKYALAIEKELQELRTEGNLEDVANKHNIHGLKVFAKQKLEARPPEPYYSSDTFSR